jgi:hypothetical protein
MELLPLKLCICCTAVALLPGAQLLFADDST